jgi:hypothetical protein
MNIYNFDAATGRYISSSMADISPMEPNTYLLPANAVTIAPPNIPANKAAIINEQHTGWTLADDFVGTDYWLADGSHHTIDEVGISLPTNALTLEPLPLFILSTAQLAAIQRIKTACGAAIIAGISNSALGAAHSYPTAVNDQTNIIGLITESLLPGAGDDYKFWCADGAGIWARRIHTKLQIQAVGLAVSAHIKAQQGLYEEKLSAISVATDQLALDAITWN